MDRLSSRKFTKMITIPIGSNSIEEVFDIRYQVLAKGDFSDFYISPYGDI